MEEKREYTLDGEKKFEDERGSIVNYILPESINWIGLLTSKAGTVRANHYHPIQEQKLLFITGKCLSVSKDLGIQNAERREQVVTAGQMIVTPPNVAHTVIFLEDSICANLVNGEREKENFGKHTIPHELVSKEEAAELIMKYGGVDGE